MKSIEETEFQAAVLRVLVYYKFFKFPVRLEEIYKAVDIPTETHQIEIAIRNLLAAGHIKEIKSFYGLEIDEQAISERMEDEARLKEAKRKILRSSRIISSFPFVKAVAISGSISKGVMKANGDVDFFIITKQGRLWLCRTFLILNKKILRLNSRKYFCVNYFVGDQSLSIPDQNIFTANELAHLIPMHGEDIHEALLETNKWYRRFLPNHSRPHLIKPGRPKKPIFKPFFEFLFNGKFGSWLDKRFQRATLKRWRKKFPHFGDEEFELAMRSERDVSKHHPSNFQLKIIEYLEEEKGKLSSQTGFKV